MATRALQTGGRAKSFGTKGATATCPKCCGGVDQCCFCVNLDAPPGDPCYPKGFLPPLLCNPVRSCCCGSRVRITGKVHVTQRIDRYDRDTAWKTYWETDEWDLTVVTLWHIERQQDGTCKTVYDGTESVTATLHKEYQFDSADVHKEDSTPNLGFEPGQELRPEIACRPEPYNVWVRMAPFGDGVLPGADYDILAPFFETCEGGDSESEHIDPDDNAGFEEDETRAYTWEGDAACKKASILLTGSFHRKVVYHPAFSDPYLTFEETRTGTRTASIETVAVENDCCDEGGVHPPVIPSEPGTPVDPVIGNRGFVLVPWAGVNWRGVPAPVRVWKWLTRQRYDTRGCGCGHRVKGWWEWLTT